MTGVSDLLRSLDFSEEDIATRARLSLQRVQEILRGSPVTQSELRAISRGLHIPLKSFAAGQLISSRDDQVGLLFRDAKVDRKGNFASTIETVSSFIEAALAVLPPKKSWPNWLDAYHVEEETYAEAEALAASFRELHYKNQLDDPAVDLPNKLVNGLDIVISRLKKSQYEGASIISRGYCFIFVSPRFPGRMLFTLAHELGHLLAHHNGGGLAIFDRPTEIGRWNRNAKSEAFVDAFASNVLLPARGVARSLKKIRELYRIEEDAIGDIEILVLARAYGVSFEAAAYRCEQLDLLPRGGASSLNDYLKKNFGSAERRAEELGLPARQLPDIPPVSSNILEAVTQQVSEGEISIGWASDRLGITLEDIYAWHSKDGGRAVHH